MVGSTTPILKNELDIVIPTITCASRNFTYLPAASIILAVSNLDRRGIRFTSLRNFSRFCFLLRSVAMLWGSIEGPVWYRYNWFSTQLELLFTKDDTGETDWYSVATPEIFLGKFSMLPTVLGRLKQPAFSEDDTGKTEKLRSDWDSVATAEI